MLVYQSEPLPRPEQPVQYRVQSLAPEHMKDVVSSRNTNSVYKYKEKKAILMPTLY